MRTLYLITLFVLSVTAEAAQPPISSLISMNSSTGIRLFESTPIQYKRDYFQLSQYFNTQATKTLCSIASANMLLNRFNHIGDDSIQPSKAHFITQIELMNTSMKPSLKRKILKQGLYLHELADVLKLNQVKVSAHYLNHKRIESFRKDLIQALNQENTHLIINYDRTALGQSGQGHFSPIGAYHPTSDRFLVMDVANYRYPMVWVKTEDLFHAMQQPYNKGHRRGYLIVQRP
ncbi:MAG: hypothetical protein CMF51_04050 [Legionellales bacterium]|nr:hypothetical protein [Legionellales bacterium]